MLMRHNNILPLCGIAYGFGPVPAIAYPRMSNGSLSTCLDENHERPTNSVYLLM
ncbi:hypothetical protein C8R48DRAFT_695798 [Suillus tomentosus]|nr:hypothetical protein C8R48DRAFT_695798 [Suillus tomentosus]